MAGGGDRRRHRLRGAETPARCRGCMAAQAGTCAITGRPVLRHARPDRPLPVAGLGRQAAAEGNLRGCVDGADAGPVEQLARRTPYLTGVELTARKVRTNVGFIQDPGHEEPWIIAMSETPGYLTTLDYARRWGIEPMFSDFKTRGFGLEDSQIRYPDRLARLILVMTLALYLAVSTGQWDALHHATPAERRRP